MDERSLAVSDHAPRGWVFAVRLLTRGARVCDLPVFVAFARFASVPRELDIICALSLMSFGCNDKAWSLKGTIAGHSLQDEAMSAEAHVEIDQAGDNFTVFELSSLASVCAARKTPACYSGSSQLFVWIVGIEVREYEVVTGVNPILGQAGVEYRVFGTDCDTPASDVLATSGTIDVTRNDLLQRGIFSAVLNVVTPQGNLSGQVNGAHCPQ